MWLLWTSAYTVLARWVWKRTKPRSEKRQEGYRLQGETQSPLYPYGLSWIWDKHPEVMEQLRVHPSRSQVCAQGEHGCELTGQITRKERAVTFQRWVASLK